MPSYSKLEDSGVRDLQEKIAGKVHANNVAETVREVLKKLLRLAGYAYLVFRLHPLVLLMVLAVAAVRYFLGMKREKNDYAVQPQMAGFSRKYWLWWRQGCWLIDAA